MENKRTERLQQIIEFVQKNEMEWERSMAKTVGKMGYFIFSKFVTCLKFFEKNYIWQTRNK